MVILGLGVIVMDKKKIVAKVMEKLNKFANDYDTSVHLFLKEKDGKLFLNNKDVTEHLKDVETESDQGGTKNKMLHLEVKFEVKDGSFKRITKLINELSKKDESGLLKIDPIKKDLVKVVKEKYDEYAHGKPGVDYEEY